MSTQAPTFATAITLARGRWGKRACVRLTWVRDSWVASAGRTTAEGSGVDLPHSGLGSTAPEAIAALCELLAAPSADLGAPA